MKEIVFATNNEHKIKEISNIVGDRFRILSLKDIGCVEDIPETANSLEGNALLKSRFVFDRYGKDCFADDTGLEVDSLHGKPGVHSARFAGDDCIAENNINKLLRELQTKHSRKARFRTVICLIIDKKEYLFEGVVNGEIIHEKRGRNGFGYDPVFLPDGYEKTFAEMDLELKNSISHRAIAIQKLIKHLKNNC